MSVFVCDVEKGSPCYKKGMRAGDTLLSLNGNAIDDVLDYRFYATDEKITLSYRNADGKIKNRHIRYDGSVDGLGLHFETYLMDRHHSCKNKCIFCFIDQMPKGMRDSLYFKDDDARLSFLFGNYITLTGLSEREIERIIHMHISPINISVHTMNPELRVKMMANPHAGESLSVLHRLSDAGIRINTQLVLCPGINDGDELAFSLRELGKLYPSVQSIAAVPVGLTKYRDGLFPLRVYTAKESLDVIQCIDAFNKEFQLTNGSRIAYAADEFYLNADMPLPDDDYYGDYCQLDNGVGMLSLLRSEFEDALRSVPSDCKPASRTISLATGVAAYPMIKSFAETVTARWPQISVSVYCVKNRFFGESVTVAGLITGQDLVYTLKNEGFTGGSLLLPSVMFRGSDDLVFLDDMTVSQLEQETGASVIVTPSNGEILLNAMCGIGEDS